jgi:hypothetical protein
MDISAAGTTKGWARLHVLPQHKISKLHLKVNDAEMFTHSSALHVITD